MSARPALVSPPMLKLLPRRFVGACAMNRHRYEQGDRIMSYGSFYVKAKMLCFQMGMENYLLSMGTTPSQPAGGFRWCFKIKEVRKSLP